MILRKCLASFALLVMISCQTPEPTPQWQPDVYKGNSEKQVLQRDDGRQIRPSDPVFDNYVCIHLNDLEQLFSNCIKDKEIE